MQFIVEKSPHGENAYSAVSSIDLGMQRTFVRRLMVFDTTTRGLDDTLVARVILLKQGIAQ
jgi:hypothetical protein